MKILKLCQQHPQEWSQYGPYEYKSSDCEYCKLQKENEKLKSLVKNYQTQLDLSLNHFMNRKNQSKQSLHASIMLWSVSLKAEAKELEK